MPLCRFMCATRASRVLSCRQCDARIPGEDGVCADAEYVFRLPPEMFSGYMRRHGFPQATSGACQLINRRPIHGPQCHPPRGSQNTCRCKPWHRIRSISDERRASVIRTRVCRRYVRRLKQTVRILWASAVLHS